MGKGDEARQKILAHAKRSFARDGYAAASIQRIADSVGVSQSAVMHHFPTKMALFAATLNDMVSSNAELAAARYDPNDDAKECLLKFFHTNYDWGIDADYHAPIMTALFHFASYDPEFKRLYEGIRSNAIGKLVAIIAAGQREGFFRKDIDCQLTAEALHDALLGQILTAVAATAKRNSRAHLLAKWELLTSILTAL